MENAIYVQTYKGNIGIIASWDCGLGFGVWIDGDIRNDGFELDPSEITPILKSIDNIPQEDIKKFCEISGIEFSDNIKNLDVTRTKPFSKLLIGYNYLLRLGYDIYEWSKLKNGEGKPLAIIGNNING